jgi:hypothetical protein
MSSGLFSVLPVAGDLFVVDGPPANYVNTNGQTCSCQVEPGLYYCVRADAVNNVAYGGIAMGGMPGMVPQSTSGPIGIPLSKIRQVYRGA